MIRNVSGVLIASCNECGNETASEEGQDFHEFVQELKAGGWKIRKVEGEWEHVCTECQDGDVTPAATSPVAQKADYVRQQEQTRPHHCHWPGCERHVPPAMWGCRTHWFRLPKSIRDRIWKSYRPGQEKDMNPSAEYLEAARAAQEWIHKNGGVPHETVDHGE